MQAGNLFAAVPAPQADEFWETLLQRPGLEIKRIVSHGQSSPPGFWYDQAEDEWVLLVQGSARLLLEGDESLELRPGSFVLIPAHRRHRVEETAAGEPTIWLAVHVGGQALEEDRTACG